MVNLTGTWNCSDGGIYFVRQEGNLVDWVGFSQDPTVHTGPFIFVNTFHGEAASDGMHIAGRFSDVPLGQTTATGTLYIAVEDANHFRIIEKTSGAFVTFGRR